MSDLISRKEAIEALDFEIVHMTVFSNDEKNGTNPLAQYNKGLEDGIKAIKALPSAEPERKWIPVTEALPKVRTDVLLAFEKNMAVGFYSHGCWNVNTGNGFYTGVFTDEEKPIAWMPLPEPYKE